MKVTVKRGIACAVALVCTQAVVGADLLDELSSKSSWVLGAALNDSSDYAGSNRQSLKPSLLWAYQYGRLRISSSGASAVLGFGQAVRGPGASAELLSSDRLKVGAGLRVDNGRRSSDSADLRGLPDIRRTVRGRLYASYALAEHWGLGAAVTQDLLGRDGGALLGVDVGYNLPLSSTTDFNASAGVAAADGRYMRTRFGVSSEAAITSGLSAFRPHAGLTDVHAGIGIITALTPRWIAFANVGASALQSDAAASPLTKSRTSASASIGLAYRCCFQ